MKQEQRQPGRPEEYSVGRWGSSQIGPIKYALLLVAVAAQLATVLITWQLWQARIDPPNLPLVSIPPLPLLDQIPIGVLIMGSLIYMMLDPRRGFWIHFSLLFIASVFDQFRMQPQFLALVILMLACVYDRGRIVCRWFLASLWFWAGLHKLISPHWFAHASFWIVHGLGLVEPEAESAIHAWFAIAIAVGELAVGLAAIFRPRWAGVFCVGLHLSIFVLLIVLGWNFSVLPWNLATAIVGCWVMWTVPALRSSEFGRSSFTKYFAPAIATIFFVAPMGFYKGLLDHGYASVLYSDYVPRALITGQHELREIDGWDPVHVPFPYERRTHRQFFELVAKEGDKLHIMDPRPALEDQFFQLRGGAAVEITREEFFDDQNGLPGIGLDDRWARFWLERNGKLIRRWYNEPTDQNEDLVSYAFTANPDSFRPEILKYLAGLPNLSQLQLADCPIRDEDLAALSNLSTLTGIGLSNTSVTDEGLKHLESLPRLRILEVENTQISPQGLLRLQSKLGLGKNVKGD